MPSENLFFLHSLSILLPNGQRVTACTSSSVWLLILCAVQMFIRCTQRQHTFTNASCTRPLELWLSQPKVIQDSNPDISRLMRIWVSAGCCQTVRDSFPCWHQSFFWVSWKARSDCVTNANKSLKCYILTEVEKWSGIRIWDQITTKS